MLKKNRISHFLIRKKRAKKTKSRRNRNRFLNGVEALVVLKPLLGFFRAKVLLLVFILAMGGFIIFSIYSPWFQIKNIEIKRDSPDLDLAAIKLTLKPFSGENLIFLNNEKVQEVLLENFKELQSIEVEEVWPDTLMVHLKTAQPKYRIQNEATLKLGVISEGGVVLENRYKEERLKDLFFIKVKTDDEFVVGAVFADQKLLEKIVWTKRQIAVALELSVSDVVYLPQAKELHLILQGGTVLWFDLMLDNTSQIEKLRFAAKEIGIGSKKIEHIDVRIPNKLFVK